MEFGDIKHFGYICISRKKLVMNENLNLCEILKDCPRETKFWSSVWGYVYFSGIKEGMICITVLMPGQETEEFFLLKNGKFYNFEDAECIIFPSKEQRDWSKFKVPIKRFNPKDFKPFDEVLVRDDYGLIWNPAIFRCLGRGPSGCIVYDIGTKYWIQCIPYNKDTLHLANTSDGCPEYYKWWGHNNE